VSDRATLRLDRGGELDGEIAPPSLYASLAPGWPSLRDEARRQVLSAFEGTGDADAAGLRLAAEQDGLAAALTGRVSSAADDLRAVYLPGLDIAQHNLAVGPGAAGLPPSALAARVEAIERYYVYVDHLLGSLVGQAGPGDVVALLTDPGRTESRGPGLLAVTGEGIRAGITSEARGADVVPTILYLLGIPVSRELSGRPQVEIVDDGFAARVPLRMVQTYGHRVVSARRPGSAPLDREMMDRLRSLGYVR
jgi:hypothetical protein